MIYARALMPAIDHMCIIIWWVHPTEISPRVKAFTQRLNPYQPRKVTGLEEVISLKD